MTTKNLLVELFVEELPPKALKKLGDAFATQLADQLRVLGLINGDSVTTAFASPRRLAAHISHVWLKAADKAVQQKLMPVSVGLDAAGNATPALIKKLQVLGADVSNPAAAVAALKRAPDGKAEALYYDSLVTGATLDTGLQKALEEAIAKLPIPKVMSYQLERDCALPGWSSVNFVRPAHGLVAALKRAPDGKAEALYYDSLVTGATLDTGLQKALEEAIAKLPIPKVMSYQLERDCALPGWNSVNFVRPAHGLVALHGSTVVPVKVLGLTAGHTTQGHRFEAAVSPVVIADADAYAATLRRDGAVIASFAERKAEIARQLAAAAAKIGGGCKPIEDDALLDEVTALVERPNVLVCQFEKEFLDVPQECLILTMKANQKYFPLLDAANKLTNQFLVVSNISPADASFVIGGNERVVRPRLADAKFFFDQDRKKTLASRVDGLGKVVYHNKLGTQGERAQRVAAIAALIVEQLRLATVPYTVHAKEEMDVLASKVQQAATLAKTDLLTDMVGEFPELQGIMGGYYARHDGLRDGVAIAIEDHYKPRFAGDTLPRNHTGSVVALADKLETLVGMFGIGNLPTGDKDPFALRRHALGVIRILMEADFSLNLDAVLANAAKAFGFMLELWPEKERADFAAHQPKLQDFIYDRLAGSLREQGYSAQEVDAVLALRPQRLGDVPKRLAAVRAFAALPEAAALAAANKRISNILKKEPEVDAHVSEVLLHEPAEKALYAAMQDVAPRANAQFEAGDYTASLQTLAALRAVVDAFFDGVMVNAEAMDVRLNRQGILKCLHVAMNRVADLSRLAA